MFSTLSGDCDCGSVVPTQASRGLQLWSKEQTLRCRWRFCLVVLTSAALEFKHVVTPRSDDEVHRQLDLSPRVTHPSVCFPPLFPPVLLQTKAETSLWMPQTNEQGNTLAGPQSLLGDHRNRYVTTSTAGCSDSLSCELQQVLSWTVCGWLELFIVSFFKDPPVTDSLCEEERIKVTVNACFLWFLGRDTVRKHDSVEHLQLWVWTQGPSLWWTDAIQSIPFTQCHDKIKTTAL